MRTTTTQYSSSLKAFAGGLLIGTMALVAMAAPPLTFLHTQSQDIVNEDGRKILLRGVGLGNWMLPEGYMWRFGNGGDRPRRIEKIVSDLIGPENAERFWTEYRNNFIAEPDIQRIAQLGYNSVRPALNARLFLTGDGKPDYSKEGFTLLDNLVRWCSENGVYVIIDMHAAPGGQTGQNIDDSANDQPELFMNPAYQDQLVALWKAIAERYKDQPAVAGYDLLNEPLPERTGAEAKYKNQLEPLYKRITKVIREVDPKHIIVLEGADWANDWSVFTKPFDPNLVYEFHYYCWDNPTVLKSIQRYLDYRNQFNTPIWGGETGEKDDAIYWGTMDYFEANNVGWSFWPWKKMAAENGPYSVTPPENWDAVARYSRGGEKPEPSVGQKAFDELLVNIRLSNCVFHPDVVNAMMRRAPGRIFGANYGHEGLNKSYFVKSPGNRSKYYRLSEPVPVQMRQINRWESDPCITLAATEWTAYSVSSETASDYTVTVNAKAVDAPAEVEMTIGDQVRHITVSDDEWKELQIGKFALERGSNPMKWRVAKGTVEMDWLDLAPAEGSAR